MRAIGLAVTLGSTPFGVPLIGWLADAFGPRWALAVASFASPADPLVGARYKIKSSWIPVDIRLLMSENEPLNLGASSC